MDFLKMNIETRREAREIPPFKGVRGMFRGVAESATASNIPSSPPSKGEISRSSALLGNACPDALRPFHNRLLFRMGRKVNVLKLCLLLIFLPNMLPAQTGKDVALMLKTQGLVRVNRASKTGAIPARKGLRLHSGNIVQTGANGFASIVFSDDKSLLKVRAKSSVTIRGKRVRGRVEKTLSMRLGELWSRVTKGSFYRVETPSGVAAVKGTQFYLICTENGTIVICIEDIVEMITDFGRMDVFPGEYGFMSPGNPPQKRKAEPGEIPDWGGAGNEGDGELEFEFEDASGQKKIIRIKYQ